MLDAPLPYIIGVTTKVWEEYCRVRIDELPDEIVILDIDKDRFNKKLDLIELPEKTGKTI